MNALIALGFYVSTLAFCAYIYYLGKTPACTADEFAKVVKQVNTLTEAMSSVQATADSMRTAVGLVKGLGR